MKLHLSRPDGRNQITASGKGFVEINGARLEQSLIVLPERLIAPWPVTDVRALDETACDQLAALGVQVLLLGTGERIAFPPPRLIARIGAGRAGVEVMDTRAACRTYNILMGEGRAVGAALILP